MRGVAMPLSLFVTFMVVGIWHGTDPGFAVFGALHGLGVLAVAPYTALLKPLLGPDGLEAYEANPWLCPLRVAGDGTDRSIVSGRTEKTLPLVC